MGNTQAKDNKNNTGFSSIIDTKPRINNQIQCESPLVARAIASTMMTDPRSPGGRRTPIHSPSSTPPLSRKAYRDKVLARVHSGSKFDPRSPSSKRTPLHLANNDVSVKRTPPSPFALGDPRSPYVMRTPLALSTQEAVVVPDGLCFAVEERVVTADVVVVNHEDSTTTTAERHETAEKAQAESCSSVPDSTCSKITTETFSPDVVSTTIINLANSPMYSPATRKRKELARGASATISPLKKSYSAPTDENAPQLKTSTSAVTSGSTKPRTPLSPLCTVKSRYSMDVQPIKLRMDPGILG